MIREARVLTHLFSWAIFSFFLFNNIMKKMFAWLLLVCSCPKYFSFQHSRQSCLKKTSCKFSSDFFSFLFFFSFLLHWLVDACSLLVRFRYWGTYNTVCRLALEFVYFVVTNIVIWSFCHSFLFQIFLSFSTLIEAEGNIAHCLICTLRLSVLSHDWAKNMSWHICVFRNVWMLPYTFVIFHCLIVFFFSSSSSLIWLTFVLFCSHEWKYFYSMTWVELNLVMCLLM